VTASGTSQQYQALVAENGVTVPSGESEAPQGVAEPSAPPTESVSTDTIDPTSTDTIDPTETVAC
jgi:hypothetical protein